MSIRHMAEVWTDPYFGETQKAKLLVALAIADSARAEDGMAWPGLEHIAKKARTSVRGAQQSIRELEQDGKLEVQTGKGPHGTNVYILSTRSQFTPDADLQRAPPQPVHPATVSPRNEAAQEAPAKAPDDCTQSVRNRKEPPESEEGSRAKREPHGLHQEFIDRWCSEYKIFWGEKYAFQDAKDGTAVAWLLKSSDKTQDQLIALAKAAWENAHIFNCDSAASLSGLRSKFNEIRAALNEKRKSKPNGTHPKPAAESSRNVGTANEGTAHLYKNVGRIPKPGG